MQDWSTAAKVVGHEQADTSGVDISAADTLIAGGRGLGSADGFRLLEALAHALGGEVAATRAVVDSGWYPYAAQVGQTGKTVTPRLYIAAGISGAIQHKVGMQGAGNHHRDQQGPPRTDPRLRRPRHHRRPDHHHPQTHRRHHQTQGVAAPGPADEGKAATHSRVRPDGRMDAL